MKIYCSGAQYNIEDFIGTDCWVRCRHTDTRIYSDDNYAYVNFVSQPFGDDFVMIRIISEDFMTDLFYGDYDSLEFWLEREAPAYISSLEIVTPIEVLSTEELYETLGVSDHYNL